MANRNDVTVVLAHGAWADGSSWEKVIRGLRAEGVKSVAAPLPLTSQMNDVAALDRTIEHLVRYRLVEARGCFDLAHSSISKDSYCPTNCKMV